MTNEEVLEVVKKMHGVVDAARALRETLARPHPPDCSCGDLEFKQLCDALDALDKSK